MLKFKRLNTLKCAKENNIPIYIVDIIRQTTLEKNIKAANKYNYTKSELMTHLLMNITKILEMTIKEEK